VQESALILCTLITGIFFKIAHARNDLYGGDLENASKTCKLDLMGCSAIFTADMQARLDERRRYERFVFPVYPNSGCC